MSMRRLKARIEASILRAGFGKLAPTPSWNGRVIALHDFKALYFLVPKVACSSLTAVCVDLLGFQLPEGTWKPGVFRNNAYDHLIDKKKRDDAKLQTSDAALFSSYWGFAFVRHPLDRLVSCYSEKIRENGPGELFVNGVSRTLSRYRVFKQGMSFESFAREVVNIPDAEADKHFRSQWTFLVDDAGNLVVDFVGRFERLEGDVHKLATRLGVSISIPHLLRSQHRHYSGYYSSQLRAMVEQRYRDDMEIFNY